MAMAAMRTEFFNIKNEQFRQPSLWMQRDVICVLGNKSDL
jgi:hypothetical protein